MLQCVFKSKLLPTEVLALRMWSGQMYLGISGIVITTKDFDHGVFVEKNASP